MFLLPYARFHIQLPLSPDEVCRRMSEQIAPEGMRQAADILAYEGRVDRHHFTLERTGGGGSRRSSGTIIVGDVAALGPGSLVTVTARPELLIGIFMLFWLAIGVVVFVIMGTTALQRPNTIFLLGCPVIIFILGYGQFILSFNQEVRHARQFFPNLIN